MKQNDTPKKQHFVPQYYLRRFAIDGECLWVDDLKRGKLYRSKVGDVCEKKYHYEMLAEPNGYHGTIILPGKIEKKLSQLESKQARLLREIDRQAQRGRICERERRGVAWLIGHLIARHPAILADYEPDYESMFSDPSVQEGCELLVQMGMANDIEILARGANQMVLALWRCKGSPTYFAKANLEQLHCRFLRASGEARFITSSLPPHFNTSERSDGKEHIDDLIMPLSNTFAVVYDKDGPSDSKPIDINDEQVVRINSGYYLGAPLRDQILSGRERDLSEAREFAQKERAQALFRMSASLSMRQAN